MPKSRLWYTLQAVSTKNLLKLQSGELLSMAYSCRYLDIQFGNRPDYAEQHEAHLKWASTQARNILQSRRLWGCNRFLMVWELWKVVHIPALTFANAITCLTAPTRERQERARWAGWRRYAMAMLSMGPSKETSSGRPLWHAKQGGIRPQIPPDAIRPLGPQGFLLCPSKNSNTDLYGSNTKFVLVLYETDLDLIGFI